MNRIQNFAIVLIILNFVACSSSPITIFQADFDCDTVSNLPDITPRGNPLDDSLFVSNSTKLVEVVNSSELGSNALKIKRGGSNAFVDCVASGGIYSDGHIVISFQALWIASEIGMTISVLSASGDSALTLTFTNGEYTLTSGHGVQSFPDTFWWGRPHEFIIDIDLNARVFSVEFDGRMYFSNKPFREDSFLDFRSIRFEYPSMILESREGEYIIDDVLITASIPAGGMNIEQLSSLEFMTQFNASIPAKNSDQFQLLNNIAIKTHFERLIDALINSNFNAATVEIDALASLDVHYKLFNILNTNCDLIVGFMETSLPGDSDYRGWGAVLVRPLSVSNRVYQAPHVISDKYTKDITLDAFLIDTDSKIAMFAGTHRYANGKANPHDSITDDPGADSNGNEWSDADVAHDPENAFHLLNEFLANSGLASGNPYWFVQLHGSKDRLSEPTIVGSDGAVSEPPHPTLVPDSPLVLIDDVVDIAGHSTMGICGWSEGTDPINDGDYLLCATTNIQGDSLEGLGLRQQFLHFEIDSTARANYHFGSGAGYNGIISLLNGIRSNLTTVIP